MPVGRIYGVLINRGITPLSYQSAVDVITSRKQRSVAAKIATWAGYGAAGVSVLLACKAIQARPAWVEGVTAASGVFGLVEPLATRAEPNVSALMAEVARDSDILHIPSGGCATTMVLAGPGKAFNVEVK